MDARRWIGTAAIGALAVVPLLSSVSVVAAGEGAQQEIGLGQVSTAAEPSPGSDPSAQPTESTLAPSGPVLAELEVFGFMPYWELPNAASVDLGTLTTLAWFGLEAGRDGRLIRETDDGVATPGWAGWTSEAFDGLLDRARAAEVRVVLAVQRFAWDRAGRRDTKALLADSAARAVLVDDIVSTIRARSTGGVNLDFEPLPNAARDDFVYLVRELRAAMDAVDPSLQLTFDLTPDVTSYPIKRLTAPNAADAAVLMGYEYRTARSRIAGPIAPLRDPDGLDLRDSVKMALARASADRVILALPWYGRAWSTRSDEIESKVRTREVFIAPSTALYRSALARASVAARNYDRAPATAWSVYPSRACDSCPLSWRQLWFDDVDSVRAKVAFALRKQLRGVGIWALGYEGARPDLWSALRFTLDAAEDVQAPTGAASVAPDSILGERDGLPVVGRDVRIDLSASDGLGGSGVAFVRLATRGRLNGNGALKAGTTFPAIDSATISLPGADPTDEVFIPGGSAGPTPPPNGYPFTSPVPDGESASGPDPDLEITTIRVQWRDIAGNWSKPMKVRVLYDSSSEAYR